MFYTVDKSEEILKPDTGNSNKYINKSGIYNVTLDFVSVRLSDKGSKILDFNIDYEGNKQTFYDLRLTANNGDPIKWNQKIFNDLCVVCGIDVVENPIVETHKLGKEGKPTEVSVLQEFSGCNIKLRVQEEWSAYQGKIRKKMVIKGVYREDGASALEVINNTDIGKQLEKDMKYSENVTYKDGLTKEDIDKHLAVLKSNNGGQVSNTNTTSQTNAVISGPVFT